jgi:hypothetical protein
MGNADQKKRQPRTPKTGPGSAAHDRAINLLIDTSDALAAEGQERAATHNAWINRCDEAYKAMTVVRAKATGEVVQKLNAIHTKLDQKRDNLVRLGAGKRIRHEVAEKTVDLLREARELHASLEPLELPEVDDFLKTLLARADEAEVDKSEALVIDDDLDGLEGVE